MHFPLERAHDRNRGSKVQHEITTSKDVFNMIQEEDFCPLLTYQIYQTQTRVKIIALLLSSSRDGVNLHTRNNADAYQEDCLRSGYSVSKVLQNF